VCGREREMMFDLFVERYLEESTLLPWKEATNITSLDSNLLMVGIQLPP
jgi:hypothetical protein